MLQVYVLHYNYPPILPEGGRVTALDGISFEIRTGGCLAVTGPNNSGKTTLCLGVAGLAPRLTAGRLSGSIRVDGRDVQKEPPGALAGVIGFVMQDPSAQLFTPSVEDEIAWGLENLGIPVAEMRERIDWALEAVGLPDLPRKQPPQELSGGEQKRLALAAALALRPRLLILDEPSGGLAPQARLEMIGALRDLREHESLTLLIAETDPEVITALADEVLLLDHGRVARRGTPTGFYNESSEESLLVNRPPANRFAAEVNRQRPDLGFTCLTLEEAVSMVRRYPTNGHHPPEPPIPSFEGAQPAIAFEKVGFAYDPARPVFDDLNLSIPEGQFASLAGDNGAGKTTLARHLIGLVRPQAGQVRILGEDSAGQSIGALARRVGLAFQNPEQQIFNSTVYEEVAFGPRNLGFEDAALEEAVDAALARFGLEEMREYPPAALSFSTRRMVALAAVAAMQTPILVLDEPTVGLDGAGKTRVMDWLRERHRAGVTVLLITHEMELVAEVAQRVLVMAAGTILADGAPREVFTQTETLHRAGLRPPFAVELALALGKPALAADLTPFGAASAWLEALS